MPARRWTEKFAEELRQRHYEGQLALDDALDGDAVRLPAHLDYFETNVPDEEDADREAYPEVVCRIGGCRWSYGASWGELADDGDVDWSAMHPAHRAA